MEDERLELQALKNTIKSLNETVENASECDTVTKEEYRYLANLLDKLENAKIQLEIDIDGCIIEEA